jgi:hypothetical protein
MKFTRLLVFTIAATLLLAATAMADVTLNLNNGFLPGGCPVGGCAIVNISVNDAGNTATFTVSSLMSGFQFDTFGFNFTGGSLALSGTPTGAVSGPSFSGLGNEDGFGKYLWNFNTGINGGSTGSACNGTVADTDCTFVFTVSGANISNVTQFDSLLNGTNNDSATWFAGHLASGTCTGYVGGGGGLETAPSSDGSCTPTVPEPGSTSLLGLGGLLSGLGLTVRRLLRR